MKKIIFIQLLFLSAFTANAQQIDMYSHYFYKPMIYNPAFSGTGNATNVMFVTRSQWSDFKGAPQLNFVSLDGNLKDKKIGLGIMLFSHSKGITNKIGGDLSYSYRLNINNYMHLQFGISIGIADQTIDYSKAIVETTSDPTLFADSQHKTFFNGNFGMAFIWKDFEFGFAIPQISGSKVKYVDTSNVRATYTQVRHYMGSLKYKFFILKEKGISVVPQVLVRFVPKTPFQYDGNINFDWQDKIWIGATYKSNYAVGANIGFCVHKQLYVGYSYDFIIGNIGKYSGLAHELMLNFKFGNKNKDQDFVKEPVEGSSIEYTVYAKRMDSIQIQLNESQENLKQLTAKLDKESKISKQPIKSRDEDEQMKNLENQINDNKKKLAELGEKVNALSKREELTAQANDQGISTSHGPSSESAEVKNVKLEDEPILVKYHVNEFKDIYDNGSPPKGFYVVAGTFSHLKYAKAEAQLYVIKSNSTNWIYVGPDNLNYIFIYKCDTKKRALEKLKIAKEESEKDAWLVELID